MGDCDTCGTPLDPPDPGPARVGRVVLVGTRLLARHAVAIAQRGDTVLILDRGDTPVTVAADRFDRLTEVTLPTPPVDSAPGRLWAALRARAAGAFRARWSDAAVDDAAVEVALISLGARRAAAVDLVTLGLAPRPELGLSRFETAWYEARGEAFPLVRAVAEVAPTGGPSLEKRADGVSTVGLPELPERADGVSAPRSVGRSAGRGGDPARLIRLLRELPPGGYPDRVRLLMPWLTELCADDRLRGAASVLVEPFATTSPDAAALLTALTRSPQDDIAETLTAYARTAGPPTDSALASAIINGDNLPAITAGPEQTAPDGPVSARADGPALAELRRRMAALASCRADPGAATDEELVTVGFVAEQARRGYLAGSLDGLPDDHEAVRHFRALLAYRNGDPFEVSELRSDARAVILQLEQPATGAGGYGAVAADPSAWPKLWRAVAEGGLVADDRVRADHPEFGRWLDLGAVYRALRDGHWAGAATEADRIAAGTDLASLRAEALNLAAYAHWQLDQPAEALRRLDEALAVHPVEGVAVNAALVATGAAVLPYLARVMGLTTSAPVRAGALTRAIDLWTAGMCGEGYPPALAAMVRGGLAVPQDDDDLHRTLLTLAFRNDRPWLASSAVVSVGPLQERTARYVQRRAAFESRPSKVSLRAVTVALVGVWRLHPRPTWAAAELSWLVSVFERLMDEPFDSATNPVPAVETLVGTEVLELAPTLTLSVRAGAFLARAASKRGQSLPLETERRLVLDPVRTYRMRHDELDEHDRKLVSAALAAGLEAATGAIVKVTVTRNRQLVRRFRQLEMEPVGDGRQSVAQRIHMLDRFDGHVRRCRAYLKAMDGLPVNEGFVSQVRDAINGWMGISTRVRRSLARGTV